MPEVVDREGVQREKVTLVFASHNKPTLRFTPRVGGLPFAEAIQQIKADEWTPPLKAPLKVRIRGEGKPENKYVEVAEDDADLILTGDHIITAVG